MSQTNSGEQRDDLLSRLDKLEKLVEANMWDAPYSELVDFLYVMPQWIAVVRAVQRLVRLGCNDWKCEACGGLREQLEKALAALRDALPPQKKEK